MEEELVQRLEDLVKENPDLRVNGNWGSVLNGRSGLYKLYSLSFDDGSRSTQWIVVKLSIKEYSKNREKGKYSVITDKEYNFNSVDEAIKNIDAFYRSKK